MNTPHPDKQGRLCCFFFCDMRRAVIIINSLSIVLNSLALLCIAVGLIPTFDDAKDSLEEKYGADSPITEAQSDEMDDLFLKLTLLTCIGMVFSGGAIFGALHYKYRLVLCNAGVTLVSLILTIKWNNEAADDVETYSYGPERYITYLIGTFFSMYAHLSLVKEIRCGIMTAETYAQVEAHSCCCLPSHITSNETTTTDIENTKTATQEVMARDDDKEMQSNDNDV